MFIVLSFEPSVSNACVPLYNINTYLKSYKQGQINHVRAPRQCMSRAPLPFDNFMKYFFLTVQFTSDSPVASHTISPFPWELTEV